MQDRIHPELDDNIQASIHNLPAKTSRSTQHRHKIIEYPAGFSLDYAPLHILYISIRSTLACQKWKVCQVSVSKLLKLNKQKHRSKKSLNRSFFCSIQVSFFSLHFLLLFLFASSTRLTGCAPGVPLFRCLALFYLWIFKCSEWKANGERKYPRQLPFMNWNWCVMMETRRGGRVEAQAGWRLIFLFISKKSKAGFCLFRVAWNRRDIKADSLIGQSTSKLCLRNFHVFFSVLFRVKNSVFFLRKGDLTGQAHRFRSIESALDYSINYYGFIGFWCQDYKRHSLI